MLSLSKFFLFALLISPGIASCQDHQVKANADFVQEECRSCGCNKNKTKRGKKQHTRGSTACETERCGICAPAPQEEPIDLIEEEIIESKCGCSAPPVDEPVSLDEEGRSIESKCGCSAPPAPTEEPDELSLLDLSKYYLECSCGKPPKKDLLSELVKQIEQRRPKPKNKKKQKPTNAAVNPDCGCQTAPTPTPDCGCQTTPAPTPDCGCQTFAIAEGLHEEIKCGICAPAPEEETQDTKRMHHPEILGSTSENKDLHKLIASLLQLAASATKKEDASPAAHTRSIISITNQILDISKKEHIRSQLFSPYLSALSDIASQEERTNLVRKLLASPEDSRAFISELLDAADEYLSFHKTTLQDALSSAFNDLTDDAQRTANTAAVEEFSIGNIKIHNGSGQELQIIVRTAQ